MRGKKSFINDTVAVNDINRFLLWTLHCRGMVCTQKRVMEKLCTR